jgi:hypothetical protein
MTGTIRIRKQSRKMKDAIRRSARILKIAAPDDNAWPPIGAVQLGPYTLGAGEYWVGDIGTVLGDMDMKELGDRNGVITLDNGREIVRFKFREGAGVYPGKDGHHHIIHGNTIGITRVAGLEPEALTTGQIAVYESEFSCTSVDVAHPDGGGRVSFNSFGPNVEIDSDDKIYSMGRFIRDAFIAEYH